MIRSHKVQISRQQKHILLLALFRKKHEHQRSAPTKREVLNYIRIKKMIVLDQRALSPVSTGEPSWENDMAWRREDLSKEGLMYMPEHGLWSISEDGEREVIDWCATVHDWTERRPNWRELLTDAIQDLYGESVVMTSVVIEMCLFLHNELIPALRDKNGFPHGVVRTGKIL